MSDEPEVIGQLEFASPLFNQALEQFHQSARALELSDNIIARMKSPDRSLMVSLPIKMDNGSVQTFLWLPRSAQHGIGVRVREAYAITPAYLLARCQH